MKGSRITSVRVLRGKRVVKLVRGKNLKRVSLKRPTRKAFSVRVRARSRSGRTVTVVRRYKACR